MRGETKRSPRSLGLVAAAAALLLFETASAIPFDAGIFTQNHLRQCSGPARCIGGDPSLQFISDSDRGVAGSVGTQVIGPSIGTQSATAAGYDGSGFTPAISAYAFTDGPYRYTLSTFGLQRYEFVADGQVTLSGTLTFSQSGQTAPSSRNPRGLIVGSFMTFQMLNDVFDPQNCNLYNLLSGPGVVNEAGAIASCLRLNGQNAFGITVDFAGLQNFRESIFAIGNDPVANGALANSLTVSGNAGDVFYLATSLGIRAHLGGFADSRNTLTVGIDQPAIVNAAFRSNTFVRAPVPIPEPGALWLLAIGLSAAVFSRRR